MATKKTKSKSSSSTTKRSSSVWSLNKISFWTIVAVTLLYAVSLVLAACGISSRVVGWLQGVASAFMIVIVAVLAWRYVRNKQVVYKVLYFVCLLIVLAAIVVPLVI